MIGNRLNRNACLYDLWLRKLANFSEQLCFIYPLYFFLESRLLIIVGRNIVLEKISDTLQAVTRQIPQIGLLYYFQ